MKKSKRYVRLLKFNPTIAPVADFGRGALLGKNHFLRAIRDSVGAIAPSATELF